MSTRGALFDPIFGAEPIAELVSDQAWVAAMLEVEAALSRAAAGLGLIAAEHAAAVDAVCADLARPDGLEIAALGRASVAGGNPIIPIVQILRARAAHAGAPAGAVHPGATSQDVMDSALMLLAKRAGAVALADARAAADAAAELARVHRATPMVARTLGQQALPSTFGLLAATWLTALDSAADRLEEALHGAPVQFGGAAGTLAASHPAGPALSNALADELGLARRAAPWHTDRTPIAAIAAALGIVAGAVSKPATDIIAMSATELAEVAESSPGGSSAMPHKRNPVAAITARAATRRAPGLVATALASMDHEFARAAGAWHAEWETITDLLRLTGGAAHQLSASLSGLRVDADAMAWNLAISGGAIMAERVTAALSTHTDHAREIVTSAAAAGRPLDRDPAITEHLTAAELAELLDPARYVGHATDLVDYVLAQRLMADRTTEGSR